jgi:hypothetical protein
MGAIRVRRRKLRKSIDHHPQTRPMVLFIQPIFFQPIVCVWFAMLIVPRHVLFATRISAIPIFMHVLSVITSIAAAVCDDHCANGHWTDSDTAAELNHSWRNKSAFGSFRIGSMNLSPPTGRNVLVITKPRVSLTPAPSRVVGHTQRSGTAQRNTLNDVPTLISFLLRAIRQGLSSSADRRTVNDHTTVKLLSQEIPLEVSL